jgi:hypothetical protein
VALNDPIGDAAQQCVRQPGVAVRADHDQAGVEPPLGVQDGGYRPVADDLGRAPEAGLLIGGQQLRDPLFGVMNHLVPQRQRQRRGHLRSEGDRRERLVDGVQEVQ